MGENFKTLKIMRKFKVSRKIKIVFLQINKSQIDITLLVINNVLQKLWNKMFAILKENYFELKIPYPVTVTFNLKGLPKTF